MGDLASIAIALAAFLLFAAALWAIGKVCERRGPRGAGRLDRVFLYLCYALFRAERF